jgi:hypothetical protein
VGFASPTEGLGVPHCEDVCLMCQSIGDVVSTIQQQAGQLDGPA